MIYDLLNEIFNENIKIIMLIKAKKYLLKIILFFNLFHILLSVIPNWNLTLIGENLLTSDTYTKTIEKEYGGNIIYLAITFTKNGDTITKKNELITGNTKKEVYFDDIQSFYIIDNNYYICPKGNYHLYNLSTDKNITPSDFLSTDYELKCYYHDTSSTLLVFYLMNGKNTMYYISKKDGYFNDVLNKINFFSAELYDIKFKTGETSESQEYHMLSLTKKDSSLKANIVLVILKNDYTDINQSGSKEIDDARTYVKACFKVSSDGYKDFYYISYNNINEFYSGYTTNAPDYYSLNDLEWKKSQATFEFFEDVEIEEMKFLPYNRYVYYKMRKKDDVSSIIYYGIFDTKLFKVIFNTDEYIKYYMPYSDREMLIVTDNSILKVCAIKDANGNCVDFCDNYLISTQGNKCSSSDSCNSGEYMLVPDLICNQTCDENLYYYNGTHCGLCSYFYPEEKKYKLIGTSGCIESKKENMDYFNERLNILKCKEGFIIKDNNCVQNITCFNRCKTCEEESSDVDDQKCKSCTDEYLLENGNCLDECSNGFYKKDKECLNCSDNTCLDFETNNCDCKECINGFNLNNNKKCENCSDNTCLDFETNTCDCKECINGFHLNNIKKCEKCSDDACLDFETNTCKCINCSSGFYINDNNK